MKIITVPHPTLRTQSEPVKHVDKKLTEFLTELQNTLVKKRNPKGVGLAAPQVNTRLRAFVTQLSIDGERDEDHTQIRTFINPEIVDHSKRLVFGPNRDDQTLEGCLSIPGIYGPVPRWEWVDLTYQIMQDGELATQTERFKDFAARVVQHEHDHLNGILFIDYSLEYDLPLYRENKRTEKLQEIAPEMVPAFVQSTFSHSNPIANSSQKAK